MRRAHIPIVILTILAIVAGLEIVSAGAQIRRAELAWRAGEYARAAASYEFAAELLPWRPDLWERAAAAALSAGEPRRVIADITRLEHPSRDGSLLLGAAYLQSGELGTALATYQSSLQTHGPSPALYAGMAEVYRRRGDMHSERLALVESLKLDSEDARAHYRLGLLLMILDPQAAAGELMLATSLDPEFDPAVQTLRAALNLSQVQGKGPQGWISLGRALGLVEDWPLAAEAFRQAIAADGRSAEAWAWLGEAKQHDGRDGRAELDKALLLDPKSPIVRGLRGLYWKRQGRHPQALAEYLLAAELEPKNPFWQESIGESYALLGDLTAALKAYQGATEISPQDANAWRLLAVFCNENGVFVEELGLPAARKAVELQPDDLLAQETLGWAYFSSGRLALAERTLLEVLEREPDRLWARLHLAMTYLAQGNSAAAYDQLLQVRNADKNGAAGQSAGQLLNQYFR